MSTPTSADIQRLEEEIAGLRAVVNALVERQQWFELQVPAAAGSLGRGETQRRGFHQHQQHQNGNNAEPEPSPTRVKEEQSTQDDEVRTTPTPTPNVGYGQRGTAQTTHTIAASHTVDAFHAQFPLPASTGSFQDIEQAWDQQEQHWLQRCLTAEAAFVQLLQNRNPSQGMSEDSARRVLSESLQKMQVSLSQGALLPTTPGAPPLSSTYAGAPNTNNCQHRADQEEEEEEEDAFPAGDRQPLAAPSQPESCTALMNDYLKEQRQQDQMVTPRLGSPGLGGRCDIVTEDGKEVVLIDDDDSEQLVPPSPTQ